MILTESAICIPNPNELEVKNENRNVYFRNSFIASKTTSLFIIVHYQVMTPFKPHQSFVSRVKMFYHVPRACRGGNHIFLE